MKIGDYVYDSGLGMHGLIIEVTRCVIPYRVLLEDGKVYQAAASELTLLVESFF